MARLEGVNIEKMQGGLQRLAEGTDNHVAYILAGLPAIIAPEINNSGKGVVLKSLYDAEQLGINESFDANNDTNFHSQIGDFFRIAPQATLYLFDRTTEAELKAFINQNKEIKGYGFNVDFDNEDSNITAVINEHQKIINDFSLENRFVDFCFIGFDNLNDFSENLFELQAPNVSVIIGCDSDLGKVAIGTALGACAVRKISENLGSVDIENKPRSKRGNTNYSLTDTVLDRWIKAYLPDGRDIESLNKSELKAIMDNGFITVAGYEGYDGYYFENSYTCIERISDFAFVENNRTWNKAARIIRATLLPRVKSKVKKDPATGYIAATTVGYWETLLNKAVNQMVIDNDISGFEIAIEPKQVVNSTNPVRIQARIVADGIVHEFEVALGLTNNI